MSGPVVFGIFVTLVVLAVIVWAARVWRSASPGGPRSRVSQLRREYERLTGLPPAEAYDSLERHLERLMQKQPGKSLEFYLDAIVRDLKRDKR